MDTSALWTALRDVKDPEFPMSIVDMGLVRGLRADDDGRVQVDVTFTSMACPCMGWIVDDVKRRLLQEPGVVDVDVRITWDKAWSASDLTPTGRQLLKEWGVAP